MYCKMHTDVLEQRSCSKKRDFVLAGNGKTPVRIELFLTPQVETMVPIHPTMYKIGKVLLTVN